MINEEDKKEKTARRKRGNDKKREKNRNDFKPVC